MFNTCRGRAGVEDGSSSMSPPRRLKLTSRTMMLSDDASSSGRPPDSELWDRLTRSRPARLPSEGDKSPSRPFEASETSVTEPSALQAIPSHTQQSVLFRLHDAARPPSWDSPARNCRREPLSSSVQELIEEAMESSSTTIRAAARPRKDMGTPLLHSLHEERSCCCCCFCMVS
ncbi:hypothetical protein CFC21_091869 [Triticum aestivum]|uniref:Uncharacterized protein n=2 Tax=Triticum aestivum TaxID=4565 RepID=A0A9R1MTH4_WHEAT|nr:hypothetical protein CFC21_091869 [Triticum aestivum]